MSAANQLSLFPKPKLQPAKGASVHEVLSALLTDDLDFHGQDSSYASHNFHSFPAKYPPQLPQKFIHALTAPGDSVLDPMMGSGTTLVESYLSDRLALGFDIDPLAVKLSRVKTTPLDKHRLIQIGNKIIKAAAHSIAERHKQLETELGERWDAKTRTFVDYWFAKETQIALWALMREIEHLENSSVKTFFEIVFSATIITKTGGVSLALDLAHTRPHRAKIVYGEEGDILLGENLVDDPTPRLKILTKKLRSPLGEFSKRLQKNLMSLPEAKPNRLPPLIDQGDSQNLSIPDESIDLIVTSPPYASNAIDYMRAHKFSLVWMQYNIDDLGQRRGEYIGGESTTDIELEALPEYTSQVVEKIQQQDAKKGRVLHRYYSEMTRTLREMYRVLKPDKVAVVVVGSSIMRGRDTETGVCLADIGRNLGFEIPRIGMRNLDRNRRMMPSGATVNKTSQIQQRMHQEFVIGCIKPAIKD